MATQTTNTSTTPAAESPLSGIINQAADAGDEQRTTDILASIDGLTYGDLIRVPLDAVEAPEDTNSRKYTSADIKTLAGEILATGRQLQPVGFVGGSAPGKVRLVYGFRRYKALKSLQSQLPEGHSLCWLEGTMLPLDSSEQALFEYNVRENTNRMELSSIDQAHALDRLVSDYGMTLTAASQVMGKSKAWGSQTLSLLRLPETIQKRVHTGQMGAMAAYELSRLDPEKMEAAIQSMDAAGDNSQSAVRSAMRDLQDGGDGDSDGDTAPLEAPAKSNLIKPRTLKEFRAFMATEMGRVESSLEEGENPLEISPRYKLMTQIISWLDGRGGRGADKKLRKAFSEAVPEVGDAA